MGRRGDPVFVVHHVVFSPGARCCLLGRAAPFFMVSFEHVTFDSYGHTMTARQPSYCTDYTIAGPRSRELREQ